MTHCVCQCVCVCVHTDVDEGGETTLPLADAIDPEKQVLDNPSVCASKMGIAIRPRRGK